MAELVEKIAWGIHYARGYGSPRKAWAEMDDEDRALLFAEAQGAIEAYEAAVLRGEVEPVAPDSRDERS